MLYPPPATGEAFGHEQLFTAEGAPWQTPGRITCHLHSTLIENCIDEHGLDLLKPATLTFYFLGSERHS
jgi:hypothetical protein